jgi:ankyrin repeat protein
MLEKGAQHVSDFFGDTPIHIAVFNDWAHVLHHFAHNVNARGMMGKRPLMIAAKLKHLECV